MLSTELKFEPIDLNSNADICVEFRTDSFVCSFGSAERFFEDDGGGAERYLAGLKRRMLEMPGCCVHVWKGDAIVGQIEMDRLKGDPSVGYVSLYYLTQSFRNQGLGCFLDQHATAFLRSLGFRTALLSVSPTNPQAVRFYSKHGWRDLGPRPDHPELHFMEKVLAL